LKSKKIKKITISNKGEPFEDSYIKNEFLFNLHKTNVDYVTILTNAVHVDREYLTKLKEYLDKYKIQSNLIINCSGFTKEVYESYCTGKFEIVVENIKAISELFDLYWINYIVSDHNSHLTKKEVEDSFIENFPSVPLSHLRYSIDLRYYNNSNYKELIDKLSKKYFYSEEDYFKNRLKNK
jgi:hypothetical protein